MNSNTKEELKDFIRSIIELGTCTTSWGWTDEKRGDLIDSGNRLLEQLDKDETIL
jgi:hypothetical protein